MPFGISSAPEHFQKRISQILTGLQGVLCLMDDVLIFGRDQKEHDERLFAALTRIQTAGVTLNPSKCEFNKISIKISWSSHRSKRDPSRPRQDVSYQGDEASNKHLRTQTFHGNGEPTRQVFQ